MNKMNLAAFAGRCVQGLVMGALLFLAILTLLEMHGAARLFRYQGF